MSLYSTHNLSFHSSAPSVTEQDTLSTAIEKLRQKALILQSRQRTVLDDYENSERRMNQLKDAVNESEERNIRLTKKIQHYKSTLQDQIAEGLDQHQTKLENVQTELEQLKERNHQLENNRSQICETNIKTEGQLQIQVAEIQQEKDAANAQIERIKQEVRELIIQKDKLTSNFSELTNANASLKITVYHFILKKLSKFSDENYAKYVDQTLQMKKISNQQAQNLINSQNNDFLTEILLQKFDYGDDWTQEQKRPKVDSNLQVNQPSRNMLTSVTIFDNNDNETTFNQYVAEETAIQRKRSGSTNYSILRSDPEDSTMSLRNSRVRREIDFLTNDSPGQKGGRKIKISAKKGQKSMETFNYKGMQGSYGYDKPQARRYSGSQEGSGTLKTKARDDIMEGLRCKLIDLSEEKGRLLRRLEAVQKSYTRGPDKTLRMGKIKEEITRVMRDMKLLKDRLQKIKNK
ncbi:hypothetical protein SS50377_26784 [Spironucleus salmonicida]|uniref:Uncharacterized protein n=1 Tax=Spironucleus salmonicida TaxID=348837 RepID=V6LYD9_9EUKA|nr:hypothetical protein SS50377_26784 [Spironucleus salmonicida]|eukprot:EST49253.1 Hypothetical protein SS50377_10474 [Spironucleus salmonicida]